MKAHRRQMIQSFSRSGSWSPTSVGLGNNSRGFLYVIGTGGAYTKRTSHLPQQVAVEGSSFALLWA